MFLEKAHALSQECGNIPVVLAGDLNSVPQVVPCNVIIHGKVYDYFIIWFLIGVVISSLHHRVRYISF